MAQAIHTYITTRFDNFSDEALTDALGDADAVLKGEPQSLGDRALGAPSA
jgi:hypothetical protein